MRPVRPIRNVVLAVLVALSAGLVLTARARGDGSEWPRRFDSASGAFVVYQPQPEELHGDVLTGRMAFSVQKAGEDHSTFGVIWFQTIVQIDRDSSTVEQRNLDVTLVRMPGIRPDDAKRYETLVESEANGWDLNGSFEELQSGLAASAKERASIENLDHRPPRILFVYHRALLVAYDGAPVLEPIDGSRLQRVSNTPYAVVQDPARRTYYLRGSNLWYTAKDPLGPWNVTDSVPADVAGALPPDTSTADPGQGEPPAIVTATEPTELIAFDGEPLLEPLVGSRLLYVTNTESDVLRYVDTQSLYVLLSGRWYTARSEQGPWTYVAPDQLPDAFRQIPPDSPRGNVLASVAGTDQADDAVADDEIPQTSAIRRDARDVSVAWDGAPQFERIPGTALEYGVNTDAEVLSDGRRYYLCNVGVWYVADDAQGPWSVSVDVPVGLDDVPPSCPVYNLRWVDIYEVTPTVVYVGYLPGYLGYYPCGGTVVYGTGYRYKPWRGRRHYYPRFVTWGFGARYNPWVSRWSFGYSYGAGFLRAGTRWRPDGGREHERGDIPWFGPGGYRRPWLAGDRTLLRTPPPRRHSLSTDMAPLGLYNRPENSGRVVRFKNPSDAPVVNIRRREAPLPNNVFAGRDGKVYQRTPTGQWNVNDGRNWVPTRLPAPPVPAVSPPVRRVVGDSPRYRKPSERPLSQPRGVPAPASPGRSAPIPRMREFPRPAKPAPAATPGGLEREFKARERSISQPPPPPPPPASAPVAPRPRPEDSRDQPPPGRRHR